ncbi:MAG: DUF4136 domain-containing protein [Acidobacteriota bacterium]|nr:DUF4136 domain-containing protein [Acidobacteriota bacterium]
MWHPSLNKTRNSPLLLAAIVASGLFFAGCDEHVDVVRDHNVVIPKHATWAWKPAVPEKEGKEIEKNRVISRDVISEDGRRPEDRRRERAERDPRIDNDTFRMAVRTDIERTLADKGFKQVDDPAAAEFLVDYHVGIHRRTMRVARYAGGYPSLVCGPFGCWESYRWGYWGGPYGYQNVHYREGTIVFDFIKQGSNKVAFRAVGQRQIHRDSFSTDHVRDAVRRLLRDLKPNK